VLSAVVDTNVFVSSVLGKHKERYPSACDSVVARAARGEFILVSSPHMLDELGRTLRRVWEKKMPAGSPDPLLTLMPLVARTARVVRTPRAVPSLCRDPDDDHVIAAAVAARADYIVTRDDDLLTLGSVRGIPVIEPRDFLVRLERDLKRGARGLKAS
jgi:putative PIN family toxin of toxin-antitoxin system